mmetsp:Transcript_1168/g.2505  ORF Transcript_1168/g.2505 Transcript_1168/m.2505 type:complete len:201 (-) Transcript_1168:375-977(-)
MLRYLGRGGLGFSSKSTPNTYLSVVILCTFVLLSFSSNVSSTHRFWLIPILINLVRFVVMPPSPVVALFLCKMHMLSRRQARWSEFLSRFKFTIEHIPGAKAMLLILVSQTHHSFSLMACTGKAISGTCVVVSWCLPMQCMMSFVRTMHFHLISTFQVSGKEALQTLNLCSCCFSRHGFRGGGVLRCYDYDLASVTHYLY